MRETDWNDWSVRSFSFLFGRCTLDEVAVLVVVNGADVPMRFELPAPPARPWHCLLASTDIEPTGSPACASSGTPHPLQAGFDARHGLQVLVAAEAVAILSSEAA